MSSCPADLPVHTLSLPALLNQTQQLGLEPLFDGVVVQHLISECDNAALKHVFEAVVSRIDVVLRNTRDKGQRRLGVLMFAQINEVWDQSFSPSLVPGSMKQLQTQRFNREEEEKAGSHLPYEQICLQSSQSETDI